MSHTSPLRLTTAALFTTVLAGTWDIWWHGALGRESFWSPPHIILYSSVLLAIGAGYWGWRRTQDRSWKWFTLVLLLIPASAPFDELWHRMFGVELVSSPLIIWSPPHVVLALSLIASFLMLFFQLAREEKDAIAQYLLQSAALGCVLSMLLFLVTPLEPTGPYHLLGFYGAAFSSALIAAIFLLAREWMQRFGSTLLVAGIFLLIAAMDFGEKIGPNVHIQPHDHSPSWLMIFACLVPAEMADLLHEKALWFRGGIVGLLHAAIFFGFSSQFFTPQFQYSSSDMWTAIISSVCAGIAVGAFLSLLPRLHFSAYSHSHS